MRIVYHLGFTRTASTILQKYVFPTHKNLNYLGCKDYRPDIGIKIKQGELNEISNKYLDIDIENNDIYPLKKDYSKFFSEEKVNIISGERYTSYKVISNNFREFKYLNKILENEKHQLSVDFLIVLRDQYDLIKSHYHAGYQSLSRFLNIKNFNQLVNYYDYSKGDFSFHNSVKNNFSNIYNFRLFADTYDFYKLINNLSINFKDSNFKFLYYEDLKNNPDEFIFNFSDFLKVDRNYTKSLFSLEKKEHVLPKYKNKIEYDTNLNFKITQNSFYKKIKEFIPLKMKNLIKHKLSFHKEFSEEEDKIFSNTIKNYYKENNLKFFKKTLIKNKYNY
tara:strand:- start:8955 stop:9956 length:1002 start_codon:yes stop_codon:yes gene_type:complete